METETHMRFVWPHDAVAAVSLTFDGATRRHLDACHILDRHEVPGTVYADPMNLLLDVGLWKDVASRHEIGAHPFFACADEDGLVPRLSEAAVKEEIRACRAFLADELGIGEHSAALPLVRTLPDEGGVPSVPQVIMRSIVRLNEEELGGQLRSAYETIRGPLARFNEAPIDFQSLRCCRVDGLDAVTIGLIAQIAISQGSWAILSWGGSPDLETVSQVARWLRKQPIWLASVIDVAAAIRATAPVRVHEPPT